MKLRIKSNTIRLRLSKDEVQTLVSESIVTDRCALLGNNLDYGLKAGDGSGMTAAFEGHVIVINIPSEWIKDWHLNDKVGFEAEMDNGCYILVEKDFQCLVPRAEEAEDDLYPNPQG
ncbi:MAG: DUF7009 family protein [Saprospiraceae bacterium]|jgi:hypothetical protein|nr:hypothetical protein [Chitinophagia bacterium]